MGSSAFVLKSLKLLRPFQYNTSKHYIFEERNVFYISKKTISCLSPEYLKKSVKKTNFKQNETCARYLNVSDLGKKTKEYAGRKLVGFTMDQMFAVVSDVGNYKHFVPFCKRSDIVTQKENELHAKLEIGFPPVVESYVSNVYLVKPNLVKAKCTDGKLFNHLTTTWQFSPGLKDQPQTCVINFFVSFEFKSLVHSQMAHLFFNQLVTQMEGAFIDEARNRFGDPIIETVRLKVKPHMKQ